MIRSTLIIAFVLVAVLSVSSQNSFQGGIAGGFTMTQISGDNLAGFDQFGISAGPFIRREISGAGAVRMEINFTQKGSRKIPDPENGDYNEYRLRLNYAEVPLLYEHRYKDIVFQGGLYVGFLLGWKEETQFGDLIILDQNQKPLEFEDLDVGMALGLYYEVTEKFFVSGRYTGSLLPVRKHPSGQTLSQALGGTFTEANAGQYSSVLQFGIGVLFQ